MEHVVIGGVSIRRMADIKKGYESLCLYRYYTTLSPILMQSTTTNTNITPSEEDNIIAPPVVGCVGTYTYMGEPHRNTTMLSPTLY